MFGKSAGHAQELAVRPLKIINCTTASGALVLDFGPTFQVFEDVRFDPSGGMAAADIKLANWKLRGNPAHSTAHIIHPTALDGALQLPVVALGAGMGKAVPTMVPSRIANLWISGYDLGSDTRRDKVAAVAKAEYRGLRGTISEVLVIDSQSGKPKVIVEGLETIIIKSGNNQDVWTRPRSVFQNGLDARLRYDGA